MNENIEKNEYAVFVPPKYNKDIEELANQAAKEATIKLVKSWGGVLGIASLIALGSIAVSIITFIYVYVPTKVEKSIVSTLLSQIEQNDEILAAERERINKSLSAVGDIRVLGERINNRKEELDLLETESERFKQKTVLLFIQLADRRNEIDRKLQSLVQDVSSDRNQLEHDLTNLAEEIKSLGSTDEATLAAWLNQIKETENAENILRQLGDLDQSIVPVGGVIMWWGDMNDIPENYELCDGQDVETKDARLVGKKPDMRSRFICGNIAGQTRRNQLFIGGRDYHAGISTESVALSIAHLPAHAPKITASITGGAHTHSYKDSYTSDFHFEAYNAFTGASGFEGQTLPNSGHGATKMEKNRNGLWYTTRTLASSGGHSHQAKISAETLGENKPHSHPIPRLDNRPKFQSMFFIIRVN